MKYFKLYEEFGHQGKYDKAAKRIADIYLKNIDSLPKMKQQHFLSRLEVVYKKRFDNDKLEEAGRWLANKTEERFRIYQEDPSPSYDTFIASRVENNADPKSKSNGNEWMKSMGKKGFEFLAYLEILKHLNIVKRLRCEKFLTIKSEIEEWLIANFEKALDFVMKNPEAFLNVPVQSVNIFYYMKTLNLINRDVMDEKEKHFLSKLRSTYGSTEDMNDIEFHNYLYAITHIIIGESWFYENLLPTYKVKYGWIIDSFDKNYDRILEYTDDIIAEIGVVYLICLENNKAEKYRSFIYDKISKYGWILPLDGKLDYNKSEHTNILAIMLLHGI